MRASGIPAAEKIMEMEYLLCDEPSVREELLPFTFTRPVALLRVGIGTLQEKWNAWLGPDCGFSTPSYLKAKFPARFPAGAGAEQRVLLVNASFVPDQALSEALAGLAEDEVLQCQGAWVAFWEKAGNIGDWESGFCLSGRRIREYLGQCLQIRHPWDIFTANGKQIEQDLACLMRGKRFGEPEGTGIGRLGRFPVLAEEGARVDYSLLDTTEGPIYLGRNTRIMPGCYVQGPLALCEGSLIKPGAKIHGGNTFGPFCKVAGEVENTVMIGYSNKAHDGFLGDSVIGEWCNLGAGTNNSNLKNDYSPVRVWSYARESFVKTGLQFCGLFMGDHSKSAIGTQFNTGTVVGVGANVFASGFPKNFIPSFTWGKETYRVERAIETAKTVWARRGKVFDEAEAAILVSIHEQTTGNRERSQREDRLSGSSLPGAGK